MIKSDKSFHRKTLANLFAVENLHVVHEATASTASFDIKRRVLTLPVWNSVSDVTYIHLIAHECSHALHTTDDYIAGLTAIVDRYPQYKKSIFAIGNIIEDCRIDKKIQNRFPGLLRTYKASAQELLKAKIIVRLEPGANVVSVICDYNIYGSYHDEEAPTFDTPVEKELFDRSRNLNTIQDTIQLTEDCFKHLLEQSQEDEVDQSNQSIGETLAEAELFEGEGDKPSNRFENNQVDDLVKEIVKDLAQRMNDAEKNAGKAAPAKHRFTAANKKYVYYASKIDASFFENEQTTSVSSRGLITSNPASPLKEFRQVINHMVSEFEIKKAATLYNHTKRYETGEINTNALHSYRYNDQVFLTREVHKTGKNHGLFMVIDWSSSMAPYIDNTLKQVYMLCDFCSKVQIPFSVYRFRDTYGQRVVNTGRASIDPSGVGLVKIVDSRNKRSSLSNIFDQLIGRKDLGLIGSTPLATSVFLSSYAIRNFKAETNSEIVHAVFLTDGDNNVKVEPKQPSFDLVVQLPTGDIVESAANKETEAMLEVLRLTNPGSRALNIRICSDFDHVGRHTSSTKLDNKNVVNGHGGFDTTYFIRDRDIVRDSKAITKHFIQQISTVAI